jgi:hypothetical protein
VIFFVDVVLPGLGVFVAEINAATQRPGVAGGAEAFHLIWAALGFAGGEELGKRDGIFDF